MFALSPPVNEVAPLTVPPVKTEPVEPVNKIVISPVVVLAESPVDAVRVLTTPVAPLDGGNDCQYEPFHYQLNPL